MITMDYESMSRACRDGAATAATRTRPGKTAMHATAPRETGLALRPALTLRIEEQQVVAYGALSP
jgi:hypothetical protein